MYVCVCVVGVITEKLPASLSLHSKEFKYVNEISEFPFYNSKCPLVVWCISQIYHYRVRDHVKESNRPQENKGV